MTHIHVEKRHPHYYMHNMLYETCTIWWEYKVPNCHIRFNRREMESRKKTYKLEIEKNAKLSNIAEENRSASTNSNNLIITEGQSNNYVMCVMSDTDDDDIHANGRVDNELPTVYFLNDETTMELVEPSIGEFNTKNTDSNTVMIAAAESLREQSTEQTQNPQRLEEHIICDVDLTQYSDVVASNIAHSPASNKRQHEHYSTEDETTHRECINPDCMSDKTTTTFCEAPMWALSYFNVQRQYDRRQDVCEKCFDRSINDYERMCVALIDQRPLSLDQLPARPEVVEIVDSDDETDGGIDSGKPLPSETLALLEDHLDDVLKETTNSLDIERQMAWANEMLERKMEVNAATTETIEKEIDSMQKLSDSMYTNLYKRSKCVIEHLPPLDLNTTKRLRMYGPNYPPRGVVTYPPVEMHSLYYAVRNELRSTWMPCKVVEQIIDHVDGKTMFRVRFLRRKLDDYKTLSGNHLAYGSAPSVRINVGTRVIALPTEKSTSPSCLNFLAGFVGETLQADNQWRYLIFFDNGCVRYASPDNIRLICLPSANVWDDVHPETAAFAKTYLEQYKTERPMIQVKQGQKVITEWNAEWRNARVDNVDGSLVCMYFEDVKRWEWIYRGSTRLGPLYKQQRSTAIRGNEPVVEYVTIDDDDEKEEDEKESENCLQMTSKSVQSDAPSAPNPVGIPTTSQTERDNRPVPTAPSTQPIIQHMNNSTIYIDEDIRPKGRVGHYSVKRFVPPRKYVFHICGVGCLRPPKYDLSSYSALAKPLMSGWDRKSVYTKAKKSVVYRTPCGRIMRNMHELHTYLRATECPLNVENFDFGVLTACLAEYVVDKDYIQKMDLSDGREAMNVSSVNYYDNTQPPPCEYSAQRIPSEEVPLNLDANFLCGCDCNDDCWDKAKCQCWKMTLEGARQITPYRFGYEFKRLPDPIPTGIYECNSQCKCSKMCLNRVAQHPLQQKLQVFKTVSRGWGLRCLNDVPKGSFVCLYAGDLLTDKAANAAGASCGDEYFAELDFIEVVESLKEGYESEVMDEGSARNFVASGNGKNVVESTALKAEPTFNTDEEDSQRSSGCDANSSSVSLHRPNSILQFYDKNEMVFTMDAMQRGNIGRYLNHSCEPNLFVQNVFVDTHDLRFPWVAFFAKCHIPAGTELTWDYSYVVDSVPGKVLFCECGSSNCRRRIL